MSQRLLRIEADVHQLKEILLPTSSPDPQNDDDQKGGDTDDDQNGRDTDDDPKEGDTEYVQLGSTDNTLVQTEPPQTMHESDPKEGDTEYVELGSTDNTLVQTKHPQTMHKSDKLVAEEPDRPTDTKKLAEASEHDDEHDDECQILDMNFIDPTIPAKGDVSEDNEDEHDDEGKMLDIKFIDPIIPVQGEDSDVASEDTQPLSRKRKAADTDLASSHTDTSLPSKKPKSIHQLQVKGSFEAQMQKFLEYQSKSKSSQPPPSNSKSRTENILDRIDRKKFQDVLK
ncbi:hypothetical protein Lser_V15G13300 [Lactuca serriola]